MKRIFCFMFIAVAMMFAFNSCSQEDQLTGKNEMNFKIAINNSKRDVEDFTKKYENVFVKNIRKARATNGEVPFDEDLANSCAEDLAIVGRNFVSNCETIGLSRSEMDEILPIDDNEVIYGMIAAELMPAIDITDDLLINGNFGYQIYFDKEKFCTCLFTAITGFSPEELGGLIAIGAAGATFGRDDFIAFVADIIKSASNSMGKAVGGVALLWTVYKFMLCYSE